MYLAILRHDAISAAAPSWRDDDSTYDGAVVTQAQATPGTREGDVASETCRQGAYHLYDKYLLALWKLEFQQHTTSIRA